jgi:soluble lytic murein transglycosylase-like protein
MNNIMENQIETQIENQVETQVENQAKKSKTRKSSKKAGALFTFILSLAFIAGIYGNIQSGIHGGQVISIQGANHFHSSTAQSYASYQSIARQAALSVGINPARFIRQIQQESGFNPYAVSPVGAIGIAQFMPATAASMGVNPYNPVSALYGAARMMRGLQNEFGGNYSMALAAYNAGPGAVQYAIRMGGSNWLAYLPAETQNYVRVIY